MIAVDRDRLRDEVKRALSDPQRVVDLLGIAGPWKRQSGGGLSVRCPLHSETHPSCSLSRGADGTLRVACFAGCNFGGPKGGGERALWMGGMRLAVAMRDAAGRIVGIQARNLEPGKAHDFRVLGQSAAGLFGDPAAVKDAANVVVCEGLSDTLAAVVGMAGAKSTAIVGIAGTQATAALYTLPMAGKRVMIATDADVPGDEAARKIGDELERLGARPVVRIRPEGGKDLAELHARGVNLLDFARGAVSRSVGFVSAAERVGGERAAREALVARALPFGIGFLDRAFGGILPDDELLVGAASGVGKTELAKIIAQHNASNGKRVFAFFLEAANREIERRIKFNLLSGMVFSRGDRVQAARRWNFLDWYYGRLNDLCDRFEAEAEAELQRQLGTLFTFYRVDQFSAMDFARAFAQVAEEADLVLLDHFHFLDAEADGDGTAAQRRAASMIRTAVGKAGKPLTMIAHVRKLERKAKQIILLGDDFQGASEVWKASTQAVMLSKALDVERTAPHLWPTYINPVKLRLDGQRARYCGLVDFDASKGRYADEFDLGTVSLSGDKFSKIEVADWPEWARIG